jgi:hypothetical protein
MSNETKRDVFEVALNHATKTGWIDYGQLLSRYNAALTDDLPVIPQAVAYAIEWFQQNDETIGEVWRNLYEDVDDDWHECPQLREAEEWMLDNQDTFTRAWVLGQWEAKRNG